MHFVWGSAGGGGANFFLLLNVVFWFVGLFLFLCFFVFCFLFCFFLFCFVLLITPMCILLICCITQSYRVCLIMYLTDAMLYPFKDIYLDKYG